MWSIPGARLPGHPYKTLTNAFPGTRRANPLSSIVTIVLTCGALKPLSCTMVWTCLGCNVSRSRIFLWSGVRLAIAGELDEDIVDGLNELCAILNKLMAAGVASGVDGAGDGEDVAALICDIVPLCSLCR